jgi:Na+/H+-dicarboxylate symporter
MGRKFLFFGMIFIGILAGLAYGWLIQPGIRSDLPLKSLRQDFKSDYVLMVAEIYDKDGDLKLAIQRLDQMEPGNPIQLTSNALVYARSAGYSINDLDLISRLIQDMQGSSAPAEATPSLEATP